MLIFKFFFSSFSATRYNLNTQKLLNLRKSYVPIVLSVTPDPFLRHRNNLKILNFYSCFCRFCCARVGGQITQKLLKNLVAPKMYSSGNSLFFKWILWILPPYPGGAEVTDSTERGSVASVSSATQNQLFL